MRLYRYNGTPYDRYIQYILLNDNYEFATCFNPEVKLDKDYIKFYADIIRKNKYNNDESWVEITDIKKINLFKMKYL